MCFFFLLLCSVFSSSVLLLVRDIFVRLCSEALFLIIFTLCPLLSLLPSLEGYLLPQHIYWTSWSFCCFCLQHTFYLKGVYSFRQERRRRNWEISRSACTGHGTADVSLYKVSPIESQISLPSTSWNTWMFVRGRQSPSPDGSSSSTAPRCIFLSTSVGAG